MRAEEFDQATIDELLARANKCFELAQSPLEETAYVQVSDTRAIPLPLDDAGKLRLLLEAQFYLTAVARKRDERVANRDFWMEVAVIALIGVEIVLGVVGIVVGIREGNKQAQVLSNIEKSTGGTAGAMSAVKTSLETLSGSQTKASDASQRTADILEKLEARQERIENTKPHLVMYLDGERLPLAGRPAIKHPERSGLTVDFELGNTGPIAASGVQIRVYAGYGITDIVCLNEDVKPTHVRLRVNDTGTSVIFSIPETITNNRLTLSLSFKRNESDDNARIGSVRFEGQTKESPNWVNLGLGNVVLRL